MAGCQGSANLINACFLGGKAPSSLLKGVRNTVHFFFGTLRCQH
jgi:hypothetical protein